VDALEIRRHRDFSGDHADDLSGDCIIRRMKTSAETQLRNAHPALIDNGLIWLAVKGVMQLH
jgi:hypothetical protein